MMESCVLAVVPVSCSMSWMSSCLLCRYFVNSPSLSRYGTRGHGHVPSSPRYLVVSSPSTARVSHTLHAKGIFGKGSLAFLSNAFGGSEITTAYTMLCCTMQGEWERGEAGRSGGKGMSGVGFESVKICFLILFILSKRKRCFPLFSKILHIFCSRLLHPAALQRQLLGNANEALKMGKTSFIVFWKRFPESSFCVFPSFQIICWNVGLQLGENKVPFRCCGDVFWKRIKS